MNGYKDESVNGAHDGTYAEKIRKDSIINQNAASQWSTTVPHMDGQVGSTPTGGTLDFFILCYIFIMKRIYGKSRKKVQLHL